MKVCLIDMMILIIIHLYILKIISAVIIELLRDIKNIMSEEIYILEINDIKYLIFKNNYN